jgi:hypothetical protein
MDKITGKNEVSHALIEPWTGAWRNGHYVKRGKTRCGRTIEGRTGACQPIMISCGSCRRSMRADGWQV